MTPEISTPPKKSTPTMIGGTTRGSRDSHTMNVELTFSTLARTGPAPGVMNGAEVMARSCQIGPS